MPEWSSPLILDQVDDPSDTGSVFVCQDPATAPSCSLQGNTTNGQRPNRDQVQIVQVVSCGTVSTEGQACNGTNVTITPGLYMANWSSTKSPGAWCYGVESLNSSDDLIQNNILQFIAAPLMMNGSRSGCVIAYNFATNDFFTASTRYVQASTNQHSAGIDMLLYEGNVVPQFYADNFHGTHNLVTAFRNQFIGNDGACYNGTPPYGESACNNNQVAMDIRAYSRFYNLIGNVLGQSGTSDGYQSGSAPIYRIGGGNSSNA